MSNFYPPSPASWLTMSTYSLTTAEKAVYLDEGGQFDASPSDFLAKHLPPPPTARTTTANPKKRMLEATTYQWPERLIFFGALEPTLMGYLGEGGGYKECRRFFNSHIHDDSRRTGDVVVWCLRT